MKVKAASGDSGSDSAPHLRSASSPSPDGCFQQDDQSHHRAQTISNWFLDHELTGLKRPPREQVSDRRVSDRRVQVNFCLFSFDWLFLPPGLSD